MALDLFWR